MLHEIQPIAGQGDRSRAAAELARRAVAIAPAPGRGCLGGSELLRCRKKINFKTNPYTGPQAVSIARRNARERNRVKQVNDGFAALRRHLPASVVAALSQGARRGAGKKLSKVDTLRMVVEYIRYLQQLLDAGEGGDENACGSPLSEMSSRMEGFACSSPCPSPAPSESSSGVSSGYSVPYGALERYETPAPHAHPAHPAHPAHAAHAHQLSPMEEDELLDVISWWQQK